MKIQLIHPFCSNSNWADILKDVDSLAGFERRIKKFCDSETDYLTEDEKGNKVRSFLGDAWENRTPVSG